MSLKKATAADIAAQQVASSLPSTQPAMASQTQAAVDKGPSQPPSPELEKNAAVKASKLHWDLLPVDALEQIVHVLELGRKKYGANQWREQDCPYSMFRNAMKRHEADWDRGMDFDEESKLLQMAHIACNALFLLEYQLHQKGKDDRFVYPARKAPGLKAGE